MFKPAPMSHASMVVLERDERDVLRCLGRLGVLQLTRLPAGQDSALLPPPDHGRELAQCNSLAARAQELRRMLEIKSRPAAGTVAEMSLSGAEEKIALMEKTAGDLIKNRNQIAGQAGWLAADAGQWSDFRGLEIPLDRPDESSYLHFIIGTMPVKNFDQFQGEIGEEVALLPLPGRKDRQPLVVMTTRQGRPALEDALRQAGFEPATLPIAAGNNLDAFLNQNRQEQESSATELERMDAARQALAEQFALPLAGIELTVETERHLLEAAQNFSRTQSAVLLTGWIPSAESSELENRLREITAGHCVVEIAAPKNSPDEQVPVLLHHPRWLRPFEMLVTAYGLPHYRELEPTLFVALSYVLMFGVMFGDIGHGSILALGGFIAMWRSHKVKVRDLGLLFLFAGLSSMFFGFLYGSFFGLPSFNRFALWHDPLDGDPMSLMTGAIGAGIIMISLGLVLNVINRWRHGDFLGSLLGKFGVAGAVFYWGSLMLLTQYAAVEARGLVITSIIVFMALPILGWTLKEPFEFLRHRHAGKTVEPGSGLVASFSESLVGAFEAVVSYFANTISFVRLAAYAMSHAALLMAAFLMADAVKHVSPVGGLLSVLVIILGNAVALALEGGVASVQALRLEYHEFFGKFFSGGGRPFKPFRLQTTTVAGSPLR
jgi:V/A-type H+/Na+-transporting ATPase subunit I